jgi:hypothetical protein
MDEDGREAVEQMHRSTMEPCKEQDVKGRQLVEAEALKGQREERERQRSLVEQVHRDAIEQGRVQPPPAHERPTIPYTELPVGSAASPIAGEGDRYRREVGQLLAEGHENRWVLIKGEEIIGIWDTEDDARAVALQKYLMQPCLIQQVRSREPIVRMPPRFWGCQR